VLGTSGVEETEVLAGDSILVLAGDSSLREATWRGNVVEEDESFPAAQANHAHHYSSRGGGGGGRGGGDMASVGDGVQLSNGGFNFEAAAALECDQPHGGEDMCCVC
jgi:hypothetical protein